MRGMWCELVKTVAEDGLRLDGALVPARADVSHRSLDALITLHGVGSNFYGSSLFESLAPSLTAVGLNVVLANTRGHDNAYVGSVRAGRRWFGAAFEKVDESRFDVAAWLEFARHRGWQRVGLLGHSLGAIKGVYAAAHLAAPSIKAVMSVSPPRLSYRFFQHDPNGAAFFDAIQTAQQHVQAGQPDTLIHVRYPFPLIITAAGYLDKYGPAENYNFLRYVSQVNCPQLFCYGQVELDAGSLAFAGVPEAIREAATAGLAVGQAIEVRVIPGADHNYGRAIAPLAEVIIQWLDRLG